MSKARLIHLSLRAHKRALETGEACPAERREFDHLRFKRDPDGTPYLTGFVGRDSRAMREDQVDDACAVLSRMLGESRAADTFDAVKDYMWAYGRFGVRKKDVAEGCNISERSAARALLTLEEQGLVTVKEEQTRGTAKATPRKRYFTDGLTNVSAADQNSDILAGLVLMTDGAVKDETGIYYHGTATQSVTCGCDYCRNARDRWVLAAGGGVDAWTLIRERENARFLALAQRGGYVLPAAQGDPAYEEAGEDGGVDGVDSPDVHAGVLRDASLAEGLGGSGVEA